MPTVYSDTLWDAVRTLALAGIVYLAYSKTKEAGEKSGRLVAIRNSLGWCLGLAAFLALMAGQATCGEQSDPLHGGCEGYNDDGYALTDDQRIAKFIWWAMMLNIPAVLGALSSQQFSPHPWRRPDQKMPKIKVEEDNS